MCIFKKKKNLYYECLIKKKKKRLFVKNNFIYKHITKKLKIK